MRTVELYWMPHRVFSIFKSILIGKSRRDTDVIFHSKNSFEFYKRIISMFSDDIKYLFPPVKFIILYNLELYIFVDKKCIFVVFFFDKWGIVHHTQEFWKFFTLVFEVSLTDFLFSKYHYTIKKITRLEKLNLKKSLGS